MKKLLSLLFIMSAFVVFSATNTPPGVPGPFGAAPLPVKVLPGTDSAYPPVSNLSLLIAIAVPALIAGLKSWLPKLPSWSLPLLAPALGALSDWVLQMSGVSTNGVTVGALLGSAGVGLRELQDQLKQKVGPPPANPPVDPPKPNP